MTKYFDGKSNRGRLKVQEINKHLWCLELLWNVRQKQNYLLRETDKEKQLLCV